MKKDIFRPLHLADVMQVGHILSLVGRLKPGVTVAQAQAEASVVFPQLRRAANNDQWTDDSNTQITGLQEHVSGKLRRSLMVLWCAVGLILLIVCVNLSNLLLARATARSKEFAMRTALGAGRGRLMRAVADGVRGALGVGSCAWARGSVRGGDDAGPPRVGCASAF